jgi:hypothetical protein
LSLKGTSLFDLVPQRNCFTAHIPEYLCSCDKRYLMDTSSEIIQQGAQFIMNLINNVYLQKYKDKCIELKLDKVLRAERFKLNENKYSIIFETKPSNATFDATFIANKAHGFSVKSFFDSQSIEAPFSMVGDVIRINKYGQTSNCVSNYFVKNFCYCKYF